MNIGNRTLLLGVGAVALGMVAAIFFPPGSEMGVPSIQPATSTGLTLSADRILMQSEIPQSPTIQQMINSGQLDPPPGNTDKMYSMAVPFAHSSQTKPTQLPQNADGRRQVQQGSPQGGMLISDWQSSKLAAQTASQVATPSQSNPSVNLQAQGSVMPIAGQSKGQSTSQPTEFETPPGIGSSKGGL